MTRCELIAATCADRGLHFHAENAAGAEEGQLTGSSSKGPRKHLKLFGVLPSTSAFSAFSA
jgi:hypothetical protein